MSCSYRVGNVMVFDGGVASWYKVYIDNRVLVLFSITEKLISLLFPEHVINLLSYTTGALQVVIVGNTIIIIIHSSTSCIDDLKPIIRVQIIELCGVTPHPTTAQVVFTAADYLPHCISGQYAIFLGCLGYCVYSGL